MSKRTFLPSPHRRWPWILGISFVLILLVAIIAFQIAVRVLKSEIIAALGPDAQINELNVGLTSVQIIGIRLPAPKDKATWPAEDFLRAERIIVTPSLASLFSERIVLEDIRVEGAYLSLLRTPDSRLRLLPALTEKTATARRSNPVDHARLAALRHSHAKPCATGNSGLKIDINHIEIVNSSVDFFDASVRKTPIRVMLENLDFRLDHLRLPELTGETRLKLTSVLKGRAQDGKISIEGKIELASKASDLQTRLQGVDLTVLQAYLVKVNDVSIQRGLLDMEAHSVVKNNQLHCPSTLTLRRLELGSNGNVFLGVPRNLVVMALKGGKDKIDVRFILADNLDNPKFSLNESIAREIGVGLLSALGIDVKNLAKGLSSTGEGAGKLGESLGKMLGGQ
jgi:hypothetical protein